MKLPLHKTLLPALSLFLLKPQPVGAQVSFTNDLTTELTNIVEGFHRESGFSGVILVAVGDSIVLHRGWGLASVELGVPVDTSHSFLLASIAKSLTAAAVMRLVDQGFLEVQASGYCDQAQFNREFKAHFGVTPGRWRSLVRYS